VKQLVRSRIVVAIVIVLGVIALTVTLISRRSDAPVQPSARGGGHVNWPEEVEKSPARLSAWSRPTTTDPKVFAIAYARAIWTYDTTRHTYSDWEDAVSVFADPTGAAPQVAKSLLPLWSEWEQLELHKAHASVDNVRAETTPELQAMAHNSDAPKGWRGFVIRGKQTTVLDTETTVVERQAAVSVVCTSICKFWSATAQVAP